MVTRRTSASSTGCHCERTQLPRALAMFNHFGALYMRETRNFHLEQRQLDAGLMQTRDHEMETFGRGFDSRPHDGRRGQIELVSLDKGEKSEREQTLTAGMPRECQFGAHRQCQSRLLASGRRQSQSLPGLHRQTPSMRRVCSGEWAPVTAIDATLKLAINSIQGRVDLQVVLLCAQSLRSLSESGANW